MHSALIQATAIFSLIVAPAISEQPDKEESDRSEGLRDRDRPKPLEQAASRRLVDGIPVPPFGHLLVESENERFPRYGGYWKSNLSAWPETSNEPIDTAPLSHAKYSGGPYDNSAGKRWVEQINTWFRNGESAGLAQDAFRSFDDGHSSIRPLAFPQLRFEDAIPNYENVGDAIFRHRITFGVQSYGAAGKSVIEASTRIALRNYHEQGGQAPLFQKAFRVFYENNFLFVAPAAGSYGDQGDEFSCLSPFYLHAVGNSGSDSKLLKPLVFTSAALPPNLKTRILRQGLLVPMLMNLFRSNINGDLLSPESHVPAYALPPEAKDHYEGPSPFLDGLLNAAHDLKHIPPVCRIRVESHAVESDQGYAHRMYFEDNTYAISSALRPGQTLFLSLDLRFSWTDENRSIVRYVSTVLRGSAAIRPLNKEGSRIGIRIPWKATSSEADLRTDLLLLVHDGTYYSSPAYISILHIQ